MHRVLMKLAVPTTYHEVFKINSLKVNFHNAGHILGSTMTEFIHNDFRVVFSGDVGTSSNHLRYWRTDDMANPDVLICEGTYGGKNRKGRGEIEREFLEQIRNTLEEGGKVLIPMFAVGKTQEILKILKDGRNKLPGVDVYLEGMSIDTLRVYEQFVIYMDDKVRRAYLFNNINPFRWEALRIFGSLSERKHLHQRDGPCIIMAPSGMLRGGWSVWHLIKMAPSRKNMVAICGHMEEGTTGYDLINNKREFQLTDMVTKTPSNVNVQCNIGHFDISAHAMHNELCNFVSQMKPELLVLIHGEEESLRCLAESVKQYAGRIVIPSNGQKIDLEQPSKVEETPADIEIPVSGNTSMVFPKSFCIRVKHMGRERYMKAQDLRSIVKS
jgi:predicted metal-dependent RNase